MVSQYIFQIQIRIRNISKYRKLSKINSPPRADLNSHLARLDCSLFVCCCFFYSVFQNSRIYRFYIKCVYTREQLQLQPPVARSLSCEDNHDINTIITMIMKTMRKSCTNKQTPGIFSIFSRPSSICLCRSHSIILYTRSVDQ